MKAANNVLFTRKTSFDVNEKWYKHELGKVVENFSWKILWDVTIQTDHVIEARRPDMVIIDKTKYEYKIIDFACPFDSRIEERQKDKINGYNDLKRKLKKNMGCTSESNPCSASCIKNNTKEIKQRLSDVGIERRIVGFQKTIILYSARVLRFEESC